MDLNSGINFKQKLSFSHDTERLLVTCRSYREREAHCYTPISIVRVGLNGHQLQEE